MTEATYNIEFADNGMIVRSENTKVVEEELIEECKELL